MNRALLWKELRMQRPVVLAGIAFAALAPLLGLAALSTAPEFVPYVLAEILPVVLALLWPFLAVAAGAIAVATEAEDGTARFLLSRPVSRTRVWSIKVGAAAASLAATGVVSLVVRWVVSALVGSPPADFISPGASVHWTLFTPATVLGVGVLLFACGVLCSTVVSRPLTAAAAAIAVGLAAMAVVLLLWAMLVLLPQLEPQWLAAELVVVAMALLAASLLVFSWPDQFAARAAARSGAVGRVAVSCGATLLLCAGILPLLLATKTPRADDASVVPGSVSRRLRPDFVRFADDGALVMTLRGGGGTTQNWILMADGGGLRPVTGRHTLAPRWLSTGLLVYYSRRGALGTAGSGLDLRVTDASGSMSWLVFPGMSGVRELFFKDSRRGNKIAFANGSELTVANFNGYGHETFALSGTPLEDAALLGFNNRFDEIELLFVSGEIDARSATMHSAGTILAYEVATGRTRELVDLTAGSALPARLQNRRADAAGFSGGTSWVLIPVVVVEPRADGTAGARVEHIDSVTGEKKVAHEIESAWSDGDGRLAFERCSVIEPAGDRSWRSASGRDYYEDQVLFGDCSESARAAGGAGAIRLVGVESGNERTWALPAAWQGTLRRIYLDDSQEIVLLDIEGATPAASFAMTIDLSGVAHTYPTGWTTLGWTTLDYFLLQGEQGGDVTFAVGDARTGEVFELYPENELREVLRQRMLEQTSLAGTESRGR